MVLKEVDLGVILELKFSWKRNAESCMQKAQIELIWVRYELIWVIGVRGNEKDDKFAVRRSSLDKEMAFLTSLVIATSELMTFSPINGILNSLLLLILFSPNDL